MAKKTQLFKLNIPFEEAIKELSKNHEKIPNTVKPKSIYNKKSKKDIGVVK